MKMADDRTVVRSPQSGESLEDYLKSFTGVELKEITTNPDLSISFSAILQESFKDLERTEDGLENLWKIIERLNNFHRLRRHIKALTPIRKALLESLDKGEKEIEHLSKICAFGRILGSTVDIAGTVGGLWLRDSKSPFANMAFRAATSFGLLSLVSSASEMTLSKNIFEELMNEIKRDQQLVEPIKRWYQQCDELEEAMTAVFPFDGYEERIQNFFSSGETEFTPAILLSTFLASVAEQDVSSLQDGRLIRNLITFTLHPASQDWYEWIIFYRHPIMLDITRIVLQLQTSPFSFSLCQFIPSLPVENQNMQSFAVWGRIGLNAVTIYDAIKSLRSSRLTSVASAIKHLREHLASEMMALERIVEFVQLRKNRQK